MEVVLQFTLRPTKTRFSASQDMNQALGVHHFRGVLGILCTPWAVGAHTGSRGGRGRSHGNAAPRAAGAGSSRWVPGPARPGPAVGNRERRAPRAGGGECGRGAGAALPAGGFGPGAPGAEGAAPGMPQAGLSCPFVAPRRPGMPGWSLPAAAGPGPRGCGSLDRRGSGRPGAAGGSRPSRSRPASCPRALQAAGWRTGVRGNFSSHVCLQGKRQDLLTAFSSRRCPLSVQAGRAGWSGRGRGAGVNLTLVLKSPVGIWGPASSLPPGFRGLESLSFISALCSCFHE